MHARTLLLCALVCLVSRSNAFAAARNVEVIRNPTLLMFGEVNQMVGVNYAFAEHASEGFSSSANSLSERYSLATVAAILDPDLVMIQMDAGISYQQSFADKTSTYLDGQYNIVTTAFGVSTHPFTIISSRDSALINNGYSPAYTLTRNVNRVSATLLHQVLPVQISYGHSSSVSDGLPQDFSSTGDAMSLTANHSYKEKSLTNFALNHSTERSRGRNSRDYSLSFNNSFVFDEARRYTLNSNVQLREAKHAELPQKNFSLSESLNCRFGKALLGSLSYQFSDSSSADFGGTEQSSRNNSVTASLNHRLFASLNTGITGSYNNSSAFGGSTTSYGGSAQLSYSKLLPAKSNLVISTVASQNVTDQKIQVSRVSALEEPHSVVSQGDSIVPNLQGALDSVISVISLSPDITYIEGIDYRVNLALGTIEILLGGGIAPGTEILISYEMRVNPSISYQSNSYITNCVVTLFGGRYLLGGNFAVLEQKPLSGTSANAPLSQSKALSLNAEARFGVNSVGADYAYSDSSSQRYSKFGAHLLYQKQISRTDLFTFNMNDQYYMYPADGSGNAAYGENSFSAGASYGTRLYELLAMSASLSLDDSRSKFGTSDSVGAKVSMEANFSRLNVSLNGTTLYRIRGGSASRTSSIILSMTRSF